MDDEIELEPGDNTYVGRAHGLAAELRDVAGILERFPELIMPYERGEITLQELVNGLTDGSYDPGLMDTMLDELLDDSAD
ncbi:MAG TPA: hypothetical protein VFO01_14300 [Trebonia sp.]|nr:hypothetical protein [Trebonia sp.]